MPLSRAADSEVERSGWSTALHMQRSRWRFLRFESRAGTKVDLHVHTASTGVPYPYRTWPRAKPVATSRPPPTHTVRRTRRSAFSAEVTVRSWRLREGLLHNARVRQQTSLSMRCLTGNNCEAVGLILVIACGMAKIGRLQSIVDDQPRLLVRVGDEVASNGSSNGRDCC